MKKNPKFFLGHILECIDNIDEYTKGMTLAEFKTDRLRFDAVVRNFEIIGEAIKNLPTELREKNQSIKWKAITGMRDFLAHHYWDVEREVVWSEIDAGIPELKKEIQDIIAQL